MFEFPNETPFRQAAANSSNPEAWFFNYWEGFGANLYSQGYYPDDSRHGGDGDAFRHATWSACMCFNHDLSSFDEAKDISELTTQYYEDHVGDSGITREMDELNNKRGREIATQFSHLWNPSDFSNDNSEIIMAKVREEIEKGTLYKIVNGAITSSGPKKKLVVYKFYFDPERPHNKKVYTDYKVGECNLYYEVNGKYRVRMNDYANIVGGIVNGTTFSRYGLNLSFVNESTDLDIVSSQFHDSIDLSASTNIPTYVTLLPRTSKEVFVDAEILAKASGAQIVRWKGDTLEVFDPMYHYRQSNSPFPDSAQTNKKIFVGGPWINNWNTSTTDDIKLAANFKVSEMKCQEGGNCNCGHSLIVAKDMVDEWQNVRDVKGSLNVNSGYRCVASNSGYGFSTISRHQLGDAADISNSNVADLFEYVKVPRLFKGLAIKTGSFVHGDKRSYEQDWTY